MPAIFTHAEEKAWNSPAGTFNLNTSRRFFESGLKRFVGEIILPRSKSSSFSFFFFKRRRLAFFFFFLLSPDECYDVKDVRRKRRN